MPHSFYPIRQYMAARGPCFDKEAPSPRYKICVVATDLDYLIAILAAAVNRPDGYYVKYAPTPKDGMYLGRIFLASEDAIGTLWAEIKHDDKLLATVQDDHFIQAFRSRESLAKAEQAGE